MNFAKILGLRLYGWDVNRWDGVLLATRSHSFWWLHLPGISWRLSSGLQDIPATVALSLQCSDPNSCSPEACSPVQWMWRTPFFFSKFRMAKFWFGIEVVPTWVRNGISQTGFLGVVIVRFFMTGDHEVTSGERWLAAPCQASCATDWVLLCRCLTQSGQLEASLLITSSFARNH